MSKRYFTSDWHLNYSDVLNYSKRPFKDIYKMNNALINNTNNITKKDDIIIHVGDFFCYGSDRGSECIKESPNTWIDKLNANIFMIKGNHDKNNHVTCLCDMMVTNILNYSYVHISHHPSIDHNSKVKGMRDIIHLCGHVHDRWKYLYDKQRNILNINVGVDVWKYNIVSEVRLARYIEFLSRKNKNIENLVNSRLVKNLPHLHSL